MILILKQRKTMTKQTKHIPTGYKSSPLGPIPEDWEVKRLGEIITVNSGKDYKHLNNGNIPVYGTGGYMLSVDDKLSDIDAVGIGRKGTIDKPQYLKAPFWTVDTLFFLTTKNGNEIEFVFCLSQMIKWKKYSEQTGVPSLTRTSIDNIEIPAPPLPEQHRIVSVLSLWDTAIAKQTALIEKLTLRKRGLMQQLLTGKKRLKGFSGEWERIKAGEIFKSISVKGNGSEVLLSATQEHGVIPRDQLEGRVTMPTGDTNSFKLVEVGDFVISLRSFQGGLEYSEHRGIVSPAYTVLKPIVEINKTFYRYYFKSAEFIGHLAIAVIGIRDGKQISYDDFCFVKIPYPNIEEQKAISSIFLQADKEIEMANKKLARLQEEKKGLMQVLLTGKKRITNKI
jgi:type I restriction enzyme S subunit